MEIDPADTFPNRLKRLRRQHELTQNQLGSRVGCTGSAIWSWEVGRTQPRDEITYIRLARALGVAVDQLK